MMARWTNDFYASTRHRVVNKGAGTRHSMAFFFDPDATADLSPFARVSQRRRDGEFSPRNLPIASFEKD